MRPKRSAQEAPEHKTFALTITGTKALDDDGKEAEFTGEASPFEVKDLGQDIVPHGAFTKTLQEKGAVRPLLADHEYKLRSRAGVVYCTQTKEALQVRGVINLEKEFGRDVYSDIKHAEKHGIPVGLSIGYAVVKSHYDKERKARVLDEVKLYEVSLTQFPMNEQAGVTDVKATFTEWLERIQEGRELNAEYWAIQDAWLYALDDAIYTSDPVDERRADLETSLAAYSAAIMDWFNRHTDYYESKEEAIPGLIKSGHTTIQEHIKALLGQAPAPDAVTEPDTEPNHRSATSTQPEAKSEATTEEADDENEPPIEDPQALQLKQLLSSLQTMNADA